MATISTPKDSPDGAVAAGIVSGGRPDTAWHTVSAEMALTQQGVSLSNGLTDTEAKARFAKSGPNELPQARQRSTFQILLAQFFSLIVGLLVAATVVAFAMGDRIEAAAILVVIALNAAVGFFTEWKADQALSALKKQAVRVAQVVRGGVEREIPAAELVPGDLVILAAGARVPADGRIVECVRLQIEESVLTGESQAVTKSVDVINDEHAGLGDRLNMAFLSTTITAGRGRLLITATGPETELGKIGTLIDEATSRSTPLEQKLARLGRVLVGVVFGLCVIIVGAGWLRGLTDFWHMLEIGLSLAIAAVPEGLPAVATMTLAIGMQRMARMRALVRRLPAVETLGSVTVICTDKTGTLTKNEMTVCIYALARRQIDVSGTGYAPTGEFSDHGRLINAIADTTLSYALRIGALCNDAKLDRSDGHDVVLGDPTEAALVVAAEKAGLNRATLDAEYPRLSEVPFDSTSKRMVTIHRKENGQTIALIKGSPAVILGASLSLAENRGGATALTDADRQQWIETNRRLAGTALRVLGLAYRELPKSYTSDDLAKDLVFVGLVGMSDPLREEAKAAVATCRDAGIRTVMITGDQQTTAAEIARQLGIDRDPHGRHLTTVHGRDLLGLDAKGWQRAVSDAAVFARVSPEQKLQIVEAFQAQGQVVAMTGDGVNDAPAIKKADIGIAMGIKGTEVAKETADMVITDDNFASIVGAVEQGRVIYGNIVRFLHYLLSCNFAEIFAVFLHS